MGVIRLRQLHPRENAADMLFDRALSYPQPSGNASVRATFRHQRKNLLLTLREVF